MRDKLGRFIKGHKPTPEMIEKISKANTGRRFSHKEETKIKISMARKKEWAEGKRIAHPNFLAQLIKGRVPGEKSGNWKGDLVKYQGLHAWVRKTLGKATHCENNLNHIARVYYWANVSGEYKREESDWKQSCPSCNKKDGIKIHPRFL